MFELEIRWLLQLQDQIQLPKINEEWQINFKLLLRGLRWLYTQLLWRSLRIRIFIVNLLHFPSSFSSSSELNSNNSILQNASDVMYNCRVSMFHLKYYPVLILVLVKLVVLTQQFNKFLIINSAMWIKHVTVPIPSHRLNCWQG